MAGVLVLALSLPTVLLLLASGLWADRRFARFDQLPAHYDFKGRPTRYASRRLMVWLVPSVLSAMLGAIMVSIWLVPRQMQNGDPLVGAILICLTVLVAQAAILSLHIRWAREQG